MGQDSLSSEEESDISSNSDEELSGESDKSVRRDCIQCLAHAQSNFVAPFMKVDGDEADKLCGKYLCRTGNVAQICRHCECPTKESDNPLARHPHKTKAKIAALTRNNNCKVAQKVWFSLIFHCKHGKH